MDTCGGAALLGSSPNGRPGGSTDRTQVLGSFESDDIAGDPGSLVATGRAAETERTGIIIESEKLGAPLVRAADRPAPFQGRYT
jgi:hypothetical protein